MKNLFSNVQRAMKVASEVTAKTVKDVSKSTKTYSDIYKGKNKLEGLFNELGRKYYENPGGDFTQLLEKIAAEEQAIKELESSLSEEKATQTQTEEIFEEEKEETYSYEKEPEEFFQGLDDESPWEDNHDE